MPYPRGLAVSEHPVPDAVAEAPAVVLVHGSLDRGDSFGRVVRRLRGLPTLTYDRRGYQRSREAGTTHLPGHVDDLLAILATWGERTDRTVVVVGHSFGGDVAVGAALADPTLVAAVGAYEPPMPWLGFRRPGAPRPLSDDAAAETEGFFRRMVGDHAWARLAPAARAARLADGPALLCDLADLRADAPFDVTALTVPAVFGRGGPASHGHHVRTVAWLAEHVPGARLVDIGGAGHGAHLSHPDHFADLVTATAERVGAGAPR